MSTAAVRQLRAPPQSCAERTMPSGMAFQASTSRPHIPKISGIAPLSVQQAPGAAETALEARRGSGARGARGGVRARVASRRRRRRRGQAVLHALRLPRVGGRGLVPGAARCRCRWRRWRRAAPTRRRRRGRRRSCRRGAARQGGAWAQAEGGRPRTQTQASRNSEAEADSCAFCGLAAPSTTSTARATTTASAPRTSRRMLGRVCGRPFGAVPVVLPRGGRRRGLRRLRRGDARPAAGKEIGPTNMYGMHGGGRGHVQGLPQGGAPGALEGPGKRVLRACVGE